jgi:hypothetical protein
MSAVAIFNVVIMLLGFLVPMAVPVIIVLAIRRMLCGHSTTETTPAPPRRRWLWLGLIPLAGVSLFIGLMIASVDGGDYEARKAEILAQP